MSEEDKRSENANAQQSGESAEQGKRRRQAPMS
jgi:hypothetical protein